MFFILFLREKDTGPYYIALKNFIFYLILITNQGIDNDQDVEVLYPSGKKWTFNPAALVLVTNMSTTACSSDSESVKSLNDPTKTNDVEEVDDTTKPVEVYQVNDLVEISSNADQMKVLQSGHGEWAEAMRPTLGKLGKIKQIYPDGDLKIEVCNTTWTYNPLCVKRAAVQTKSKSLQPVVISNLNEELVKAAANGDVDKCKTLLNMKGSNANALFAGHTALQAASQNGHLNIIKILFSYNADLEIEDKDGDRAIHHAAFGDEPLVISLLAKAHNMKNSGMLKLDLNSRNKKSQTALHIAVNKEHMQVIKILLGLDAHVSLQDIDGDTPLHDAISKRNDTIVDLLLEANADLAICNKNSFNPLHHATLRGNVK